MRTVGSEENRDKNAKNRGKQKSDKIRGKFAASNFLVSCH